MKNKTLIFTFASLLLFMGCTKSHKGLLAGTIHDYTGFDGCGLVLELENGTVLEPRNWSSFENDVHLTDNQKVWVKYHSTEGASICMVGEIVKLDALEER